MITYETGTFPNVIHVIMACPLHIYFNICKGYTSIKAAGLSYVSRLVSSS